MAKKLKYQLNFKSLLNKDCEVSVYVEGYTGTTVTSLIGTSNPFEYEEDTDKDLLHFVRFRTGYLRVVEQEFGSLNGLQATAITSHYVVAMYDGTVVFTGYIQCQELSNSWAAAPRVLEFPVISPLGLLESFKFSAPADRPSLTTIGALMTEIMQTLNPFVSGDDSKQGWQGVIYPETSVNDPFYPFSGVIQTAAVCPFNKEFDLLSSADELYKPVDFLKFIEGLLVSKGWMIHDNPANIIFTLYEGREKNYRLSIENLTSLSSYEQWGTSPQQVTFLEYTYDYIDNKGNMSVFLPLKSLTLKNADTVEDASLPTRYMTTSTVVQTWNTGETSDHKRFKILLLNPVGPIVESDYMRLPGQSFPRFYTSGNHVKCDTAGVYALSMNIIDSDATSISYTQEWYVVYNTNWDNNFIFKFTAFQFIPHSTYAILKIGFDFGASLDELKSSGWRGDITLMVRLKCGDLYYNPSLSPTYAWNANPTSFFMIYDKDTGKVTPNSSITDVDDWDGFVFRLPDYRTAPIEVYIGFNGGGSSTILSFECIKINEITIGDPSKNSERFRTLPSEEKVLSGSQKGLGESDLEVTYNDWSGFALSDKSYGKGGSISFANPSFSYMFKPQSFISAIFRQKQNVTPVASWNPLLKIFSYVYPAGVNWKIISDSFNLADDEHKFILVHTDGL